MYNSAIPRHLVFQKFFFPQLFCFYVHVAVQLQDKLLFTNKKQQLTCEHSGVFTEAGLVVLTKMQQKEEWILNIYWLGMDRESMEVLYW